tara:strand:+ start:11459 stop:13114 length:1656 start_codon:yes stop_codon:yes gene_type:complete
MARPKIDFNTFVPEDLTKSTIDWGTVATGLTTELSRIKDQKEKNISEQEDKTYEINRELRDIEQYDNTTLNDLVIDASSSAGDFLKVQSDLYGRGIISQSDLTKARTRISSNFTDFAKGAKNYDASYKKYKARMNADPATGFLGSSEIERRFAESSLAFGNLEGMTEYVNPTTGDISLVKLNEDGSLPKDPSKYMPFTGMPGRMGFELDKFDVTGNIKKEIDALGMTIEAAGSIDDATKFLEKTRGNPSTYVDGFMVNPLDVASVLVDAMGGYKTETDLSKKGDNLIYIDYSNGNVPTIIEDERWEKQKEKAREFLEQRFTDQMDEKIKAVRTKNPERVDNTGPRNDVKFKAVEANLPDYSQKRNFEGGDMDAKSFMKDRLGEKLFNNNTQNIESSYNDVTNKYIPQKVKQYYVNKGQGLKTTYVKKGVVRSEMVDGVEKYFLMHLPTGVNSEAENSLLIDPAEGGERVYFDNERQLKLSEDYVNSQDRDFQYMTVEFGGNTHTIENIRSRQTTPVWREIQENIITPSIDPYNDAMYDEIYGGGAGGRYNI